MYVILVNKLTLISSFNEIKRQLAAILNLSTAIFLKVSSPPGLELAASPYYRIQDSHTIC